MLPGMCLYNRYPKAHQCYIHPTGGNSLCHFEGFKLSLTSSQGAL